MAYRSSRPDGISQLNRSNIFFLILRRLADEQRSLMKGVTRDLIKLICVTLLIPSIYIIHVPFMPYFFVIPLILVVINFAIGFLQYNQLRRLLAESILQKVESMIYSNDYQSSNLNNEELVNMTNRCSWINGRLTEFSCQTKITTIGIISIEVGIWIAITLIRVIT